MLTHVISIGYNDIVRRNREARGRATSKIVEVLDSFFMPQFSAKYDLSLVIKLSKELFDLL